MTNTSELSVGDVVLRNERTGAVVLLLKHDRREVELPRDIERHPDAPPGGFHEDKLEKVVEKDPKRRFTYFSVHDVTPSERDACLRRLQAWQRHGK